MKTIFSLIVLQLSLFAAMTQAQEKSVMPGEKIRPLSPVENGSASNRMAQMLTSIHGQSVPLKTAIEIYGYCKDRTVLRHPQLEESTFVLPPNSASKEDTATALEKLFRERNIATIIDGEHFVMVVPFTFTNAVKPHANSLAKTNSLLPAQSINFINAPAFLVLSAYADFVGKKIVNIHEAPAKLTFSIAQTTPLSREEICYALETQIAWHDIQFVPEGNDLKLERIPAPK
jgi:hypothetical protein